MQTLRKIGWDSSVMICLISDKDDVGRVDKIDKIMKRLDDSEYQLVVSTLIYPEVLESAMPVGAIDQFEGVMQNKNLIVAIAADERVARKAQTIRNLARPKLTTPDAIHIATAIVIGAEVFHTFDKKLVRLSGKSEVENLLITECTIP